MKKKAKKKKKPPELERLTLGGQSKDLTCEGKKCQIR